MAVAASPSHHDPSNNYIYDNESFEADDEADFEDLLSASVFEVGSATSVTAAAAAASSPSPRDWTPSQASSRSQLPSTQVRLRPKSRPTQRTAAAHHKLRLEEEQAKATKESAEVLTLSIRGQNCANAPAQLELHARRRYVLYMYVAQS